MSTATGPSHQQLTATYIEIAINSKGRNYDLGSSSLTRSTYPKWCLTKQVCLEKDSGNKNGNQNVDGNNKENDDDDGEDNGEGGNEQDRMEEAD